MKRCILMILGLTVLAMVLVGCSSNTKWERPVRTPQVVQTGSGVTVKSASDWAAAHPDIYASYMKNADNSDFYSYPETYPMLAVIYEGSPFSRFYNSARGHVYTLEDLNATGRPHPFSNCYACKTPDFHAYANEVGVEAYATAFADLADRITNPVSCFNCHANEPGSLTVTHTYLYDAMGPDFYSVDPIKLACAQCHVEYYFDPATRAVTLPYTNFDVMDPESILAFYNEIDFADYTNPRTGVRQLKVQHPEFETFSGQGTVHGNQFNCADCHMGTATNARGKTFANHEWRSPLQNPDLVKNNCAACHTDLAADVKRIQDVTHSRLDTVGQSLVELTEELVAAVGRNIPAARLDPIRKAARDAQFYWDFVFVENSDGAHNSRLTNQCLDKSQALVNEAMALLANL